MSLNPAWLETFISKILIRLYRKEPFYSIVLQHCLREIDMKLPALMGVHFDFKKQKYILSINPTFISKYPVKFIADEVLRHEPLHIVHNHCKLRFRGIDKRSDHTKANHAMDVAINQLLSEDEFEKNNGLTLNWLKKTLNRNDIEAFKSAEYYYNLIKEDPENPYFKKLEEDANAFDELFKELEEALNSGDTGKAQEIFDKLRGKGKDSCFHREVEYQELTDYQKAILDAATSKLLKDSLGEAMKRGFTPGNLQGLFDIINEPAIISWQTVFKNYYGSCKVPYKKVFYKRNRRLPNRLELPGKIQDRELYIYEAIDTSGSVSDKQIEYILNESAEIVKGKKNKTTVIECDYSIQRTYSLNDRLTREALEVKGRGGTAFKPVFDYLKNEKRVDLLIYFTDGFGECEIEKPSYPVLWVITGKASDLSVKIPYGRVLELNL
jgi:predicted metal-dependent peptidase